MLIRIHKCQKDLDSSYMHARPTSVSVFKERLSPRITRGVTRDTDPFALPYDDHRFARAPKGRSAQERVIRAAGA